MSMKTYTRPLMATALAVALLAATGCKKEDKDEAAKDYRFELKTGTPVVPVHVVLYTSAQDYLTFSNPIDSGKTDAQGIYVVPAAKFTKGKTYYVDIYSDDYHYNSWMDGLVREFVYGDNNSFSNYGIKQTLGGPNDGQGYRRFFIDGRKLSTYWKAVDAREPGTGSVWNSISAADQLRKLRFNRDATATYTEKDGALNDVTTSFTYAPTFQNTLTAIGYINARPGAVDTAELVDARNGLRYYFIKE